VSETPPAEGQKEEEMYQLMSHVLSGNTRMARDGRVIPAGVPEPEFLRRRYEHAQALRQLQRDARIRQVLNDESTGFVSRLRNALGIA